MFHLRDAAASRLILIGTLLMVPAQAWAVDLTGAWASDPSQCNKVFKKSKTGITFQRDSDVYGAGFVADGTQLRGRAAKCTIKTKKQAGDTTLLLSQCICNAQARCRAKHATAGIRHSHFDEPGIRGYIADAATRLGHKTPQIQCTDRERVLPNSRFG